MPVGVGHRVHARARSLWIVGYVGTVARAGRVVGIVAGRRLAVTRRRARRRNCACETLGQNRRCETSFRRGLL